ncbi:MAG: secondary thiamine-phosphate synthase enzyme YjbQ [Minisyncoccales bacterium]
MKNYNNIIKIETKEKHDFNDITDKVKEFLKESKIKNGIINLQSLHTTAALVVNEKEPLLIKDMKRHLELLSPESLSYQHDNFEIRTVNMCEDECANGHSHCKSLNLPVNISLNVIGNKLQLGQWQRIFLIELDRKRPRKVQVQIIGE